MELPGSVIQMLTFAHQEDGLVAVESPGAGTTVLVQIGRCSSVTCPGRALCRRPKWHTQHACCT